MSPGVGGRLPAWMGIAACVMLAACATRQPPNRTPDAASNPHTRPRASPPPAIATAPRPARVLLIPLDDRPPCLQFVTLLAPVGDATIIAPPRSTLGRFTEPGDAEAILRWLDGQDLAALDAVIVSTDMLAYGGLVASRVPVTPDVDARRRVEAIARIKQRRPDLPVYAFSVIMRLAPTADGRNEAWREPLARWAERSPLAEAADEVRALEARIPADALAAYTRARTRNLAINLAAVRLVASGAIDHLIVSQDDAKPSGVHVRDRERVLAEVAALGVERRVAVQPGADEVALLLLSRALTTRAAYRPRVAVTFAPARSSPMVAPFEDRPLGATVSAHIAAAGGIEVSAPADADVHLFVRASRLETSADPVDAAASVSTGPTPGAPGFSPATDAATVSALIDTRRPVIVADIDMTGRVQGADPAFTDALADRGVLLRLAGYAAWNTAGNTLGTAIPHGLLHALARERLMTRADHARSQRLAAAQIALLLHRFVDDDVYHARVRQAVARRFTAATIQDPAARAAALEAELREAMREAVQAFWRRVVDTPVTIGPVTLVPRAMDDFTFTLPWGRTFEAEIAFRLEVSRRPR